MHLRTSGISTVVKWLGLTLALAIITLYIIAPFIIKHYLNHRVLNHMGAYSGRVESVELALLRGEYLLKDLKIRRQQSHHRVDFFTVKEFAIALSWEGLRHRQILSRVKLTKPELIFLDANKKEDQQTGEGTNWLDVFESILPVTLHELVIADGIIRLQNLDTKPTVNIAIEDIDAELSNLTNVKDAAGRRVAKAALTGQLFGDSPLSAKAEFDPFNFNDFEFAADAQGIRIDRLNDFGQAYAKIDFKSGHGEVFIELSAHQRQLRGYIKPLFEDIKVLSWSQDVKQQGDNPLQLIWEAGWQLLSALVTNLESNKLATQIDIKGSLEEVDASSWQATLGVLHNAFISALRSRYEKLTPLTKDRDEP